MKLAHYDLVVSAEAGHELAITFAAYAAMAAILDATEPVHARDTFELQRLAYERIRSETGLPSRLVTNGIREYAAGTWDGDRLPLDEKLMSFKGVDRVSLATLNGRVVVGFLMRGYEDAFEKGALSHLIRRGNGYALSVPLSREMQSKEIEPMHAESLSGRVSRLAAGLVSTVIDSLERRAPEAVAEQAIREIDAAIEDLKSALAATLAERKRYQMQKADLVDERDRLDANIRLAVAEGREDLARAGIGRQDDIDQQTASIDRLIADVVARIADDQAALSAAAAARRDAEERVKIARRVREGEGKTAVAGIRRPSPEDRISAALGAVGRLTSLPAGAPRSDDLAELESLGRDRRIDDRLAALRKEITSKE